MILAIVGIHHQADSCTGITLKSADGANIVARSVEWASGESPSDYIIVPRGHVEHSALPDGTHNGMMVSHAYNSFVRGYLGMSTVRIADDKTPFNLSLLPYVEANVNNKNPVDGGKPVNVAMITGSGVNVKNTDSSANGTITWVDAASIPTVQSVCNANGNNSALCYNALSAATKTSNKYYNEDYKVSHSIVGQDDTKFDLSGSGIVFGVANKQDTTSAKIIAGWEYGGRASGDYYGFIPNGQLTVYYFCILTQARNNFAGTCR